MIPSSQSGYRGQQRARISPVAQALAATDEYSVGQPGASAGAQPTLSPSYPFFGANAAGASGVPPMAPLPPGQRPGIHPRRGSGGEPIYY